MEGRKRLCKLYEKIPEQWRAYYNILRDLKEEGIKQGVSLPAIPKKAYILSEGKRDSNHIMKRMLERSITDDEIRRYVDNAKVMFSQWGGQRQMFITKDVCLCSQNPVMIGFLKPHGVKRILMRKP